MPRQRSELVYNTQTSRLYPDQPNQAWCGDISYIKTSKGFLYLATVIDLHSRTIVGWSVQDHMRAELVDDALRMALGRRDAKPGRNLRRGLSLSN